MNQFPNHSMQQTRPPSLAASTAHSISEGGTTAKHLSSFSSHNHNHHYNSKHGNNNNNTDKNHLVAAARAIQIFGGESTCPGTAPQHETIPTIIGEATDSWHQKHHPCHSHVGMPESSMSSSTIFNHPLPVAATALVAPPHLTTDAVTSYGGGNGDTGTPMMAADYVYSMMDQSILCDQYNRPITVGRMLATKPLVTDLSSRPGPGNKKLTYLSGDSVTRSLNEIFTYTGWNLQIVKTDQVLCVDTKAAVFPASNAAQKSNGPATTSAPKQHQPMWNVAYLSHVRITLTKSGTYREDLGAGDAMDKNLGTAIQHAIKASITDAMKRAARHFGDKLGNSLYQGTFRLANAPKSLHDALDQYDKQHENAYKNINTMATKSATAGAVVVATAIANTKENTIPLPSTSEQSFCAPHSHQPIANSDVKQNPSIAIPPPFYNGSSTSNGNPRASNLQVNTGATINTAPTATNATSDFVTKPSNVQPATTKPPLTASENLQHLQSTMCSTNQNVASNNNQHLNHIKNEGSIRKNDEHKPTTTTAVDATVVLATKAGDSVSHHSTITTASTVVRPRTSSGRTRKSASPSGTMNAAANTVVAKKSKLNPYST